MAYNPGQLVGLMGSQTDQLELLRSLNRQRQRDVGTLREGGVHERMAQSDSSDDDDDDDDEKDSISDSSEDENKVNCTKDRMGLSLLKTRLFQRNPPLSSQM